MLEFTKEELLRNLEKERTVRELSHILNTDKSFVHKMLKKLEEQNLINKKKVKGYYIFYKLDLTTHFIN